MAIKTNLRNPTRPIVAERLLRLMKANRITQVGLSEEAGIAQSTIARVLNGRVALTLDTVGAVAEAMGITAAQLLADGDVEFELLGLVRTLPAEELNKGVEYLRFVTAQWEAKQQQKEAPQQPVLNRSLRIELSEAARRAMANKKEKTDVSTTATEQRAATGKRPATE